MVVGFNVHIFLQNLIVPDNTYIQHIFFDLLELKESSLCLTLRAELPDGQWPWHRGMKTKCFPNRYKVWAVPPSATAANLSPGSKSANRVF